jgi:hypothetical protein
MTVVGMHQAPALDRKVKVQLWTELSKTINRHQNNYFVIISFMLSALNIFHFIPQGLYCSFSLQFLEMKTFTLEISFCFNQVLLKIYLNVCVKGKDRDKILPQMPLPERQHLWRTNFTVYHSHHDFISSYVIFLQKYNNKWKNPHMARLYYTVPHQNQGFYKQVSVTLLPKPKN